MGNAAVVRPPAYPPGEMLQKSSSVTSPCAGVIELLTINGRFSMEEMFIQTDEQRAILESVRRFVAEVVTPKAPALDAMTDPAAGYSEEIVAAADAVGIRTMTLSEKYGGLGTDSLTTAMVDRKSTRLNSSHLVISYAVF